MRARGWIALALTLGAMLALAPNALAATFTVDNAGDASDGTLNGSCDTDAGGTNNTPCTLRAAIEEANNTTVADTINFSAAFTGDEPTDTIAQGGDLIIDEPVTIDGGNCGTPGDPKPCAGLDTGGVDGLAINNAPNVTISGLAISGADGGGADAITANPGATGLNVRGNWLGLRLNGTEEANSNGLVSAGDSVSAGGTSAAQRNVIVSTERGVRLVGADDSSVKGNYFGTLPNGTTATTASTAIPVQVIGTTTGPDPITGAVIGGADAGTPTTCDGACNLIANPDVRAIDLEGAGGAELPAGQTTISGNFLGLDKNGSTADLSGTPAEAIKVGSADDVTIGGAGSADRNYLGADGTITSLAGATNLAVRSNFLGMDAAGTALIGAGGGINLGSGTTGATISGNRVATASGSSAIVLGTGGTVQGNVIGIGTGGQDVGGANVGITTTVGATGNTIGGTGAGQGNVVGNADVGINLITSGNSVVGNKVGTDATEAQDHGSGFGGIQIGSGADGNTIGGITAASENVISNSGADAIQIDGDGTDQNQVLRNRGANNTGLFIDLQPANGPGVGPSGANDDQPEPSITAATSQQVSGSGESGATVRVYRTATAAAGEPTDVIAFVGSAVVNGSGSWTLDCPSAQCETGMPGSGQVTANQTDTSGNSSELEEATTYTDLAPDTAITSGPAPGSTTGDSTPTFGFSSSEPSSTFECKVDGGSFASCPNPRTLSPLADGQHTLQVRSKDNAAQTDPTPATRTFTVDAVHPPPPDTTAPQTAIDAGPKPKVKMKKKTAKVTFEFSSDEGGASFECSLDGEVFAACTSPHTEKVKKGKHTFEVRAEDAAGNVDQTPAEAAFKVKKRKK